MATRLAEVSEGSAWGDTLLADSGDPRVSGLQAIARVVTDDAAATKSELRSDSELIAQFIERIQVLERERDEARRLARELSARLEALGQSLGAPRQSSRPAEAKPSLRPREPATSASPQDVPGSQEYVLREVQVSTRSSRPPDPTHERRSGLRVDTKFDIEFTHETHFYAGLSLDISSGGLFIATYHLLPRGTHLWLSFQLPDGSPVRARGQVRWVRTATEGQQRPGMGVAFEGLSGPEHQQIERFCSQRPPIYVEV